ncbi:MAG: DHHA1 domain-containing protein [Syntrophobacterales bacterium]
MAPLTGTNRILARVGLVELSRTSNCGLRALKAICGLENDTINDWDVLFRLGPRLNAPGRLASGDLGVRFLLSTDSAEARNLAFELEELNRQRQHEEKELLAEALSLVEADSSLKQKSSLVLASPGWHKGLLGLVASRLVERFNKPTILLTQVEQHWEGQAGSRAGPQERTSGSIPHCIRKNCGGANGSGRHPPNNESGCYGSS